MSNKPLAIVNGDDAPASARDKVLEYGIMPDIISAFRAKGIRHKILDASGESQPNILIGVDQRAAAFRALMFHPALKIGMLKALAGQFNLGPAAPRTFHVFRRNPSTITASVRVIFYKLDHGQAKFLRKSMIANALPAEWLKQDETPFATLSPMRNLLRDFDVPVDIVITWVDGRDPAWLEKKQIAAGKPGLAKTATSDALSSARWNDFDELRFALRSIATHAPWVNRIFVVTDGQKPRWLRESPRLKILDHSEFFAGYCTRPTFNSHVIESQLHRIAGLSEHFLYFNDDFMILKPTRKADFFHSKTIAKFYPSPVKIDFSPASSRDIAPNSAGKRARQMLGLTGRMTAVNMMRHCPYALFKSVLHDIEREFAADFKRLGQSQFRSLEDFAPVSQFFQYYAFLRNRAAPAEALNVGWELQNNLSLRDRLRLRFGFAEFLCVNAGTGNPAAIARNQQRALKVLNRIFPLPSEFEADMS